MLAKWNKNNAQQIFDNKQFQPWIYSILLPYQLKQQDGTLDGSSLAVYDIGCKLHTLLFKYSLFSQKQAHNKLKYLTRWPLMHKMNIKGSQSSISNSEASSKLARNLFKQFLNTIQQDTQREFITIDNPIWQNLIEISFILEEFLYIHDEDSDINGPYYE